MSWRIAWEAAVLVPRLRFGRRRVLRAPAMAVVAPSGSGEPDQLPIH
jgi:hypothetical protein